jgi:pyruvate dehydrogenase E1 component alpha subunit
MMRLCEEAIIAEYHKDEIKTPVHLGIGAEAISLGVTYCLPKYTHYYGTYRNHNLFLSLSQDLNSFYGELFGKVTGTQNGLAGSMHLSQPGAGLIMTSAVVGTTIPVAIGSALAAKLSGDPRWTVVFFGDGATEEGVFYESLNFASLHKLKILFVCEDNELAIHTSSKERMGYKNLSAVCNGFHMDYAQASGHHLETVIATSKAAIKKAEEKQIPLLLHFDYFRFLQHVGTLEDFDAGYRAKPSDLKPLDPYFNFISYLETQKFSQSKMQTIVDKNKSLIAAAMENARNAAYPSSSSLYDNLFCEGNS